MGWVSGPPKQCMNADCPSQDIPRVTRELWDALDKVVTGSAVCDTCECGMLFTRRPTKLELSLPQQHLQPMVTKGRNAMRFFDDDRVGVFLDGVGLRLEKTKDGEMKVIDLTLRVQPFTPELAASLDPELRQELFTMTGAEAKKKIAGLSWKMTVPKQHIDVHLLPDEGRPAICLLDAEITDARVRTEKGVDGFALIFYATIGPVGRDELEYVVNWYTQQRFLTFRQAQETMDFAGKDDATTDAPPRKRGKANGRESAESVQ